MSDLIIPEDLKGRWEVLVEDHKFSTGYHTKWPPTLNFEMMLIRRIALLEQRVKDLEAEQQMIDAGEDL